MIYSRTCQHAIRALLAVAEHDGEHFCSVKEISETVTVHSPMLAKVLGALARAGLLTSTRGASGGFRLAKPPEDITLFDIVLAIEGHDVVGGCALGLPNCSGDNLCPLHPRWGNVRECIHEFLYSTTLAQMVEVMRARRGDG